MAAATFSILLPARALRTIGVAALLSACAHRANVAEPAAQADANRGALVTGLVLQGVRHVDRDVLLQGLSTKGTRCRTVLYAPLCLISKSPIFTDRRYFDPLEFRRDVLRIRIFYWRRGYRDATVDSRVDRVGGGVRAVFNVAEGEPTVMKSLDIVQTDTVLPRRVITRSLKLHAGDPLDLVAMDSTIGLLQGELWQRGYADAQVELDTTDVSEALNGGPVKLVMRPGPRTRVQSIDVEGNRKVSDRTVRRLLLFRPGDLFRRSDVLESQRNLYLSGLFSEVDLRQPPPGDSQKVIRLRVVESDLNRMELTGGFNTADFLQANAEYTRYNLIGSARSLTLRGTISNLLAPQLNGSGAFYDVTNGARGAERDRFLRPTWSTSVEMTQPFFLSPRNRLGMSVFSHRRSVPGIAIDHGRGVTLAVTHDFGQRRNSTFGYTFETTAVDASDVYFCVSFGLCDPSTIDVVRRDNPLSPVSWVTQVDYSNDAFAPTQGYKLRWDLEHASALTGSDYRYSRAQVIGTRYFGLTSTRVLAVRVRLGGVKAMKATNGALGAVGQGGEPIVHPRKRFYSGGSQSVRGFGENQLGPRVLTISPLSLTDTSQRSPCTLASIQDLSCDPNIPGLTANAFQPQPVGGSTVVEGSLEYRFPLIARSLGGVLFVDGAVISADQFANLLNSTGAFTPGFGIRFDTPVGPVRLDFGLRPHLIEQLPVVTQVSDSSVTGRLVVLKTLRRYDPFDISGGWFKKFTNRLMLHLAIGPAF